MTNVMVTGGAGYIGSHMVLKLLESNYQPIVVDNLSHGLKSRIPEKVPFYEINIGDENALTHFFQKQKIDMVMHFAASIEVGESVENPDKYYQNNFVNTLTLLNVMRKNNVNKIIFSSTAATFGEPQYVPVDEKHPQKPINPYGASKLMCEMALKDFDVAYGLKSVCLRYFNAAGVDPLLRTGFSKKDTSHLIPIVLKVAAGETSVIKINGADYDTKDGTCVRDYIHVMDLCDAHLLSMKHLLNGGDSRIYNLGNGLGYSVKEVLSTVENVTKKSLEKILVDRRQGDSAQLIADAALIKKELDWKTRYPGLETIVKHAWDWQNNLDE